MNAIETSEPLVHSPPQQLSPSKPRIECAESLVQESHLRDLSVLDLIYQSRGQRQKILDTLVPQPGLCSDGSFRKRLTDPAMLLTEALDDHPKDSLPQPGLQRIPGQELLAFEENRSPVSQLERHHNNNL